MKKLKKTFVFVIFSMLSFAAMSQLTADAQHSLSRSFASDGIEQVASTNVSGNIIVTGTSGNDVLINIYVHSLNGKKDILSPAEIERRINTNYSIVFEVDNQKLIASIHQKTKEIDWKNQLVLSLEIQLPAHLPVELEAPAGNIYLKNIAGKAIISSESGNFYISQVNAEISGKTSGGNIYIDNSGSNIYLKTNGGNIAAADCKGNLQLFTEGGMITLAHLQGKIEARTTGGKIKGKNISGEFIAYEKGQLASITAINYGRK